MPRAERGRDAVATIVRSTEPLVDSDYGDAFPNSRKTYLHGPHGIRVPVREISRTGT